MELKAFLLKKEKKWKNRYFNKDFREKLKFCVSKKHLDFGCGFGYLAYLLAKEYPKVKVYGIDKNKKYIELGKQKYKRKNLKLKSSEKIIGKFDSISSFFVIHHLGKKYLLEFYKHLNSGGKIVIFAFRKVSRLKYKKWYVKKREIGEYKEGFEESYKEHNRWSLKEFCNLMEKIGFKTLKVEKAGDYWFWYIGEKY